MKKVCPSMLTIGPTVPSAYLDKLEKDDKDYGFNLLPEEDEDMHGCIDWLNKKPAGSVVYVAFGSMAELSVKQVEHIALGLKSSNSFFLWVVRASEQEKLPHKFVEETKHLGVGLIVKWSPQLEVLSNEAVGCFLTHCGWNSTVEALCLGVPMVGMPQWTDQITVAKLVADVWQVGVRVKVDDHINGIVTSENISLSIREVMEGERARDIRASAQKWRNVTIQAISEGGTSDKNIEKFISKLRG